MTTPDSFDGTDAENRSDQDATTPDTDLDAVVDARNEQGVFSSLALPFETNRLFVLASYPTAFALAAGLGVVAGAIVSAPVSWLGGRFFEVVATSIRDLVTLVVPVYAVVRWHRYRLTDRAPEQQSGGPAATLARPGSEVRSLLVRALAFAVLIYVVNAGLFFYRGSYPPYFYTKEVFLVGAYGLVLASAERLLRNPGWVVERLGGRE